MLLPIFDKFDKDVVEEAILKRCDELVEAKQELETTKCEKSCLKVCCNILARKESM